MLQCSLSFAKKVLLMPSSVWENGNHSGWMILGKCTFCLI
uniref:Uncharacterized protein n=1 Tax=Anguilla anguilla TaxID=7936 RepID=A0A0E9R8Q8_ANGAN